MQNSIIHHITRLFPKIKVNVGETPTLEAMVERGFDIKLTQEIYDMLVEAKPGGYLVIYPATDKTTGSVIGMNLKYKEYTDEVSEGA